MKQHLITTSLMGAIDWYKKSPINWKDRAYKDLYNTLNRIYTQKESTNWGMEFENKIRELCSLSENEIETLGELNLGKFYTHEIVPEIKNVIAMCKGGRWQTKINSIEMINGKECFLFGKTDVQFPECIVDIKTTGNFKRDSYLNSMQHLFYTYLTGVERFFYIIAVWKEAPILDRVEIIQIDTPVQTAKDAVRDQAALVLEFLESRPTLWDAYRNKFCLY